MKRPQLPHRIDEQEYAGFRSCDARRDMATWLCRRRSGSPLAYEPAMMNETSDRKDSRVFRTTRCSLDHQDEELLVVQIS